METLPDEFPTDEHASGLTKTEMDTEDNPTGNNGDVIPGPTVHSGLNMDSDGYW